MDPGGEEDGKQAAQAAQQMAILKVFGVTFVLFMVLVLLLLPSLYLLFDKVIMKTRWGSPSEHKQKRTARKAAAVSANL